LSVVGAVSLTVIWCCRPVQRIPLLHRHMVIELCFCTWNIGSV